MSVYSFLYKFLKNRKVNFFIYVILELSKDFFVIFLGQYFNKKLINYLEIKNPILEHGLLLIFLYVLFNNSSFIFDAVLKKYSSFFLKILTKDIRNDAFQYCLEHDINYFNDSFSGDISSKISSLSDVSTLFIKRLRSIFCTIIAFIFTIIFYANINFYLSTIFLISALFYYFISFKYSHLLSKTNRERNEVVSQYFGFLIDNFTNITNIKSFSKENHEIENSKEKTLKIREYNQKLLKIQVKNQGMRFLTTFVLFFSVVLFSSLLVVYNKISFGDFTAIIIILSIIRSMLNGLFRSLNALFAYKGILENGIEKIYKPISINNKDKNKLIVKEGKIVFKHIKFAYEKK